LKDGLFVVILEMYFNSAVFRFINKFFTGTAGGSPATSAARCDDLARCLTSEVRSRCALTAGEPPAVPVKNLLIKRKSQKRGCSDSS